MIKKSITIGMIFMSVVGINWLVTSVIRGDLRLRGISLSSFLSARITRLLGFGA